MYVIREPVDGDAGEKVRGCLIGSGFIKAERASMGKRPLDDEPTEPIRSDIN